MKIKADAVIFDYGDTLILDPFSKILENHYQELYKPLRRRGYTLREKDFKTTWEDTNDTVHWLYCSHFSQEERLIQETLDRLNVSSKDVPIIAPEILAIYRRKFAETLAEDPRRKEVRDSLVSLKEKNKRLAVLSSDRGFAPKASMAYFGVADLFEAVFATEEIGYDKPDSRAFSYMLDYLKVKPGRAVYVGNDTVRDVDGSKSAGMKAILFIPPQRLKANVWREYIKPKYKPDAVMKSFYELPEIIS